MHFKITNPQHTRPYYQPLYLKNYSTITYIYSPLISKYGKFVVQNFDGLNVFPFQLISFFPYKNHLISSNFSLITQIIISRFLPYVLSKNKLDLFARVKQSKTNKNNNLLFIF
ncbi:hypothetical protein Rmag_0829 [Candidatus Ruthia magnifica str. Cm (Calyptogena magnifica)]|uniref:Uncharacterized protein n=1 Tax=Ruthia magnifica subsp. Calyptogena magnifica TaxID=413404 RepID=A1AX90_RUTMC|nr:hypothetical protein Rmag_0829 [Candidatus Ruthia magnifica str. Cm (Calyptogena magnifica)]